MITEKRKETIKLIVAITILALLLLFVVIMMIKYEVEGETNMPYQLSKIVIIGTVEGVETTEKSKEKWNFDIYQNNDVYFYIDQNAASVKENELIKSVKISNIQIIINLFFIKYLLIVLPKVQLNLHQRQAKVYPFAVPHILQNAVRDV